MADETQEETNNQADSTAAEETTTGETHTESETKTAGATGETESKPEFADKNMQAKFTQKMQEFGEKEKGITAKQQKIDAWDTVMSDPKVKEYISNWHYEKTGQGTPPKKEIEPISEDDYSKATTDRESFQTVVDSRAEAIAEQKYGAKIKALETQQSSMRLEQDIDDFANAKGKDGSLLHPEFWKLDGEGKISPILQSMQGSNMSGLQKVEMAYKIANYSGLKQSAVKDAHTVVAKKKQAIGEKGSGVSATKNFKGKSMQEIAAIVATDMGMKVP